MVVGLPQRGLPPFCEVFSVNNGASSGGRRRSQPSGEKPPFAL
jgi:hypothetical protein